MGWRDKGRPPASERTWRRGGWSLCLRSPSTTAERRDWDREYGRPARSPGRLPDSYDDVHRVDRYDRSWKRHRRTQYKVLEIPCSRTNPERRADVVCHCDLCLRNQRHGDIIARRDPDELVALVMDLKGLLEAVELDNEVFEVVLNGGDWPGTRERLTEALRKLDEREAKEMSDREVPLPAPGPDVL